MGVSVVVLPGNRVRLTVDGRAVIIRAGQWPEVRMLVQAAVDITGGPQVGPHDA